MPITKTINGYKVIFIESPNDILDIRFIVNAGSTSEQDHEDFGVAHYLEHMFFKGTKKRNYKEVNATIARLGDINANTSYNRTQYYINCLNINVNKALEMLCEMMFEPAFPEEEFEKERGVILQEYQTSEDSPQSHFYRKLFANCFSDKYHNILGTKESLKNMNLGRLLSFREKYYNSDNTVLCITGNLEASIYSLNLEKLLPSNAGESRQSSLETLNYDDFHIHHKAKQSILSLLYDGMTYQESYHNNFADVVLLNGLANGMHSMLFERIRQELGLCYSVGGSNTKIDKGNLMCLITFLNEDKIPLAKEEMLNVCEKVKQNGFTPELLQTSISSVLFDICRSLETTSNIVYSLMSDYFTDGIIEDMKTVKQKITSVTNEDIIAVANKIFTRYKFATQTNEN